jgi:hypothetical protein
MTEAPVAATTPDTEITAPSGIRALFWVKLAQTVLGVFSIGPMGALFGAIYAGGGLLGIAGVAAAGLGIAEILLLVRLARECRSRPMRTALALALLSALIACVFMVLRVTNPFINVPIQGATTVPGLATGAADIAARLALWVALAKLPSANPRHWMSWAFGVGLVLQAGLTSGVGGAAALIFLGAFAFALSPLLLLPQVLLLLLLRRIGWRRSA